MNRGWPSLCIRAALALAGMLSSGVGLEAGKPEVRCQVAAGGYHSLALGPDGTVWVWGLNQNGQLGDGTRERRDVPFPLNPGPTIPPILGIAAGEDHSLALGEDGSVWTFGLNRDGQLGIGTREDQSTMTMVKGLKNIVEVCGGEKHSIALDRGGRVWAWGSNDRGQLGHPTLSGSLVPIEIPSLKGILAVAAGGCHTLALKQDGSVWEWGAVGHQMDGAIGFVRRPRRVSGLGAARMISAGGHHSLALGKDGTVWAWGNNEYGQLGDGTNKSRGKPAQVMGVALARLISAGQGHSLVVLEDHTAMTWGDNNLGQLGNPLPESSKIPVQVAGVDGPLKNIETVRCGGYHTLFITKGRDLLACGHNSFGQLGDWKFNDSPFPSAVWRQVFKANGK